MKFKEFFERVQQEGIELEFEVSTALPPLRLSNEAMFHLPLIAITILMMAKGRAKPSVDQIGQLVGDCYERTFPGFRGSAQNLGWSASLRVRTVQALSFLEQASLVCVESTERRIVATDAGKTVIEKALSIGGDLASNLISVERSYRDMRVEKQLRL